MKKHIHSSAALFLAMSQLAMADVNIDLRQTKGLPYCGGSIEVSVTPNGRGGEQVNLNLRDVQRCDMFDILTENGSYLPGFNAKPLNGRSGDKSYAYTLGNQFMERGRHYLKLQVRSYDQNGNRSRYWDTIHLDYNVVSSGGPSSCQDRGALNPGESRSLTECGGSVTAFVRDGTVEFALRNVARCSRFDIRTPNSSAAAFSEETIDGPDGRRSENVELPRRFIQRGCNTVYIDVYASSNRDRKDTQKVVFWAD